MSDEARLGELLRWRIMMAEADAPPAPSARRLLEAVRPWWEARPEWFKAQTERLGRIRVAYGYAASSAQRWRAGHPVPTLIMKAEDVETIARITYLSIRDGRLRLRFTVDEPLREVEQCFEATFISVGELQPMFLATATRHATGEYRVELDLSHELATGWRVLRAGDPMPFCLILRPATADEQAG